MVKENIKEIHKAVRIKLIEKGKTIADFCREIGISYELYKAWTAGRVNGKRVKSKTKKLIGAIEKLLEEDIDTNKKAA